MSNYLDQIEDAPVTERVIVLKSTYGKQQGATTFQPFKKQGRLMGVVEYTEEEKRKVQASHIVTEDTELRIEDGFELDLSTDYGRITWAWLQHQPDIAPDQDMAQRMPDAVFYVKDQEAETKVVIDNARAVARALEIVQKESSASKRLEICRLLGNRMDGVKPLMVEEYLLSLALRQPEQIINAAADKNYKSKIFLFNALDAGLIRIENEVYKYGNMTLGISEDQTLEWLKDRNNFAVVEHLKAKVYPDYFSDNARPDDEFDRGSATSLQPAGDMDLSSPSDFGDGDVPQLTPAPGASKKK